MKKWEFYIDRGGTFTDVVARDPLGNFFTHKLLSTDEAPLIAIRKILGLSEEDAIPPITLKLGSTVGTNALLERKGRRVALAITRGFRDLLEIGFQNRPQLFSLDIRKNLPLYERVVEVEERMSSRGEVLVKPSENQIRNTLSALLKTGIRDLVIVFLHSYLRPDHEKMVEELAWEAGFDQVTSSHKISPQIKVIPRGDTSVIDGYLTPTIKNYLQKLQKALPGSDFQVMQSHGGLVRVEDFRGKDSLLSGPAGGVVGCATTAAAAGFREVIGFDMGGTSTDVSRFDGQYEMIYESEKAGVRIQAPLLNIETVAAGGGSLIHFDGIRLQVGPESAGADPGPICYGRGGETPAITDANLFLGRIVPQYFEKFPLHTEPVREAFLSLAREMSEKTGRAITPAQVALGALEIANNNMASALQVISVARGYDPREYALATFGGAGGQHGCALARKLGMKKILIHPFSSLLSALGIGLADIKLTREQTVNLPWKKEIFEKVENVFSSLQKEVEEKLTADPSVEGVEVRRLVDMRYQGQSSTLTVSYDGPKTKAIFEALHQKRFGHLQKNRPLEGVTLRVEGIGKTGQVPQVPLFEGSALLSPSDTVDITFDSGTLKTPLYFWKDFGVNQRVEGPALILDSDMTILVEPDFEATLDSSGFLILERREEGGEKSLSSSTERDPILLEVFSRLFSSVAEQMGEALKNTAFSTNIKERLDFSCALFDREGNLVANAAHIPVHLGAMSEAVKGLIESGKPLEIGDIYVSNNPFCGGSHLPDITVITPVFDHRGERIFFVANRGHHADIGGIVPGSMPAFSTTTLEEGVLIDNFRLIEGGTPHYEELKDLLLSGPYPARNIPERMSDLEAQIAANMKGVELLGKMIDQYGWPLVLAYMNHLRSSAREKMEILLDQYQNGNYSFVDFLDGGKKIQVTIAIEGRRAKIDFTGTDPQMKGNLNANPAIVKSAILYVFRTLLREDIPLNSGCLEPLEIHIPKGTLLNPEGKVAVVGGNVETSQRICDVLLGALGACGASQGTMNNFTFGNKNFGYYETIAGGSGAGEGWDGTSGVHTHMTNTRMTDPEIFEVRYPALLEQASLGHPEGGEGKWMGGRGVIRRVKFLEKMDIALLTERRSASPYGMKGGKEGARGNNYLLRGGKDSNPFLKEPLGGKSQFSVEPGDTVMIETPGGGGYGPFEERVFELLEEGNSSFSFAGEKPTVIELQKMRKKVEELRLLIRKGLFTGPTSGLAPGFVQANLVILPKKHSEAFRDFCEKNPRPCPLLEVTKAGSPEPQVFGPGADLRTDLPGYRIYRKGKTFHKVSNLLSLWQGNWVAFLLGCSFTFEGALLKGGVPVRHIEEGVNVPMYITNRSCEKAGPFGGPLVVSMRPLLPEFIDRAVEITENFPLGHGGPIQIGDADKLGISDLRRPDFGDPVTIKEGEVPVFWACGVTPQVVLRESGVEFYITHEPGHMFLCDVWGG